MQAKQPCPNESGNIEFLKGEGLFSGLSEETIHSFLKHADIVRRPKGEMLYLQGDPAETFYILLEGVISIYIESQDGHETLVNIAIAGDIFGKSALLDHAYYESNAQVLEDAVLLSVSAKSIKEQSLSNPHLAYNLLSVVVSSGYQMTVQMGQTLKLSAPQRLGCFLLKLAKKKTESEEQIQVQFPFEKRVIAAYLQMTPETFSRAIAKLKEQDVKFNKSSVVIEDICKLKKFTCGSCAKIAMPGEQECS